MSEVTITGTYIRVTATSITGEKEVIANIRGTPDANPYEQMIPRTITDIGENTTDRSKSIVTTYKLGHLETDETLREVRVTETPQELTKTFKEAYGPQCDIPIICNPKTKLREWARQFTRF